MEQSVCYVSIQKSNIKPKQNPKQWNRLKKWKINKLNVKSAQYWSATIFLFCCCFTIWWSVDMLYFCWRMNSYWFGFHVPFRRTHYCRFGSTLLSQIWNSHSSGRFVNCLFIVVLLLKYPYKYTEGEREINR